MLKPIKKIDPKTGLEYKLLTDKTSISRKLYFSSESWLSDNRNIAFFRDSDRGGQLIKLDEESLEETVLADARDGFLIHSFGLDRKKDIGYLVKDDMLRALDAHSGQGQPIAKLPENAKPLGHYTASKSGLLPMTFKLPNGIFCLALTDPAKGETEILYYSDTPLGHCQACPADDDTIFFCHETGGDAIQRMWHYVISEKRAIPYFVERYGDWVTHETWSQDGTYMTFILAPDEIWRGEKDGRNFRRIAKSQEYHHCAPSPTNKWIVADRSQAGEIVLVDATTGVVRVLVTGHFPPTGLEHQHPSFNRSGDKILFTAAQDDKGACQIGLIDLKQLEGFEA
ncbi:MAG: hypothetical protein GX345_06900 [Clostridiales bacterium]|nr:hypothetical protein [Clostridiales bacterium]